MTTEPGKNSPDTGAAARGPSGFPPSVPKRRPPSASLVGRLLSPFAHGSASDAYYVSLARDRRTWVLWFEGEIDAENRARGPVACTTRSGLDRAAAARFLVRLAWTHLAERYGPGELYRPEHVSAGGVLSVDELRSMIRGIAETFDGSGAGGEARTSTTRRPS